MDPDEALQQFRLALELYRKTVTAHGREHAAHAALESAAALDEWLTGGGFLPEAWAGNTTPANLARLLTAAEAVTALPTASLPTAHAKAIEQLTFTVHKAQQT